MLTVETIGRIRREHFLKGKTIKEIARDLKVSRNTVRKVRPVAAAATKVCPACRVCNGSVIAGA